MTHAQHQDGSRRPSTKPSVPSHTKGTRGDGQLIIDTFPRETQVDQAAHADVERINLYPNSFMLCCFGLIM